MPLAKLREHQRHVIVVTRHAAADAEGLIERLADEPRHFRVVREVEARVDVGFERKLAQQREAEGIDRRDRDVAEPFLHLAPPRRVELREAARLLQPVDDALPHFGRRLAREGDREDVIRFDAGAQQVDVSLHQHARLAGSRGGFEDDVLRGIDGVTPRVGVGKVRLKPDTTGISNRCRHVGSVRLQPDRLIIERQHRLRHRRRNPSGTPTRNCTSHSATHRRASAGIHRA
jgi:hypothetical protein